MITEKESFILVDIKVIPRSSINKLDINGEELRLKIASPPVDGAANKAIVEFFSKILSIPKSKVFIEKGVSSKNKMIKIIGLNRERFLEIIKK